MSALSDDLIDAAAQEIVFENPFNYPGAGEGMPPTDAERGLTKRALVGALRELHRRGFTYIESSTDTVELSVLADEIEGGSS